MLKGVHLTLLVGPTVPVPVPRVILDALTEITVDARTYGASGFQLRFTLTNRSPLHTLFLISGGLVPRYMRVIIVATMNGQAEVLIDGVMTHHQIAPGADGHSQLVIIGEDLRRVMDYDRLDGFPYLGMPTIGIVNAILLKYAVFGIVPTVVPTVQLDVESPLDYVPLQKGTDLGYLNWLAGNVGYVFYMKPGPLPGMNIGYWGPLVKVGVPQPALNVDMDAHTNVESLDFEIDTEHAVQPVVNIQIPLTKITIPIPVPDISLVNPPLGLVPAPAKSTVPVEDVGNLTPVKALLRGLAVGATSSDAVQANGTLDVARYGRLLQPRSLVGVRGAGMSFDGLYYVDSVQHRIQRGQYKQSFRLTRNGLVSTIPRVPA